jgi:hypothetical protein
MHPPGPLNEADDDADLEPQVLSYVQFRNRMTLLEWQRRRAAHERASFGAAMPPPDARENSLRPRT